MNSWTEFRTFIMKLVGHLSPDYTVGESFQCWFNDDCFTFMRKQKAEKTFFNWKTRQSEKKFVITSAPQIFSIDGNLCYYFHNRFKLFEFTEWYALIPMRLSHDLPNKAEDKKNWFRDLYLNSENIIYLNNVPEFETQPSFNFLSTRWLKKEKPLFIFFYNGFLVFDDVYYEDSPYILMDFISNNKVKWYVYWYPRKSFKELIFLDIPDEHIVINQRVWPVSIDPTEIVKMWMQKESFDNYFFKKHVATFCKNDKEYILMWEDIFAQIICENKIKVYNYIIVGDSNTGKSVLLECLESLYTQKKLPNWKAVSLVPWKILTQSTNSGYFPLLQENYLNLDKDGGFGRSFTREIDHQMDNGKIIFGGDEVVGHMSTNPAFLRSRSLPLAAITIIASNHLPFSRDSSGAHHKRFRILPALHQYLEKGKSGIASDVYESLKKDNLKFFYYNIYCIFQLILKGIENAFESNLVRNYTESWVNGLNISEKFQQNISVEDISLNTTLLKFLTYLKYEKNAFFNFNFLGEHNDEVYRYSYIFFNSRPFYAKFQTWLKLSDQVSDITLGNRPIRALEAYFKPSFNKIYFTKTKQSIRTAIYFYPLIMQNIYKQGFSFYKQTEEPVENPSPDINMESRCHIIVWDEYDKQYVTPKHQDHRHVKELFEKQKYYFIENGMIPDWARRFGN